MTGLPGPLRTAPTRLALLVIALAATLPVVVAVGPLASRTAWASDPGGAGRWVAPLGGRLRVLAGFDPPARRWESGHRGVDLAAAAGAPVRAAAAGVVTYAARLAGRGVVAVRHGELRTTYEPVSAAVTVGQAVDVGEVVGWLEPAGWHCGEPCLHWGLLRGTAYLDPLALLGLVPVRLLPFTAGRDPVPVGRPAGGPAGRAADADRHRDRGIPPPGPATVAAGAAAVGVLGLGVVWGVRRRAGP